MTTFQHATVRGLKLCYREAGSRLLLPSFLCMASQVRRICLRPNPAVSGQISRLGRFYGNFQSSA